MALKRKLNLPASVLDELFIQVAEELTANACELVLGHLPETTGKQLRN